MSGTRPRLLLLEFLSTDRYSQYRSEMYPFVQGWARAHDVATRWVSFGFDPAALPTNRYRMALDAADSAALVDAVRSFAPTHVLLNEELDAPLQAAFELATAAVADAGAGPPVRSTVYGLGEEPRSFERRRTLETWLGLAPRRRPDEPPATAGGAGRPAGDPESDAADPYLVDEATPDYDGALANALARRIRPFAQVLGGPGCVYHKSLRRNPLFEGLDLADAHRDFGCSFCGVEKDTRYPYATRPVALALKQIRAALATAPRERCFTEDGHGLFTLAGAAAFLGIGRLLEALLAEGLPPVELHVSTRIDELRRKAPAVEALLPRLAAAGHRLAVANMGVENFSPAENERFNKGVSEADVAWVVAQVDRWERAFPGTFRFWETGGFGFILFTPWTRVEDLRINLRAAERFRVEPGSFFFSARLQLMPGRALTLLAERDGLALPPGAPTELAGFDSGCIMSAHEHEEPWRFQHPEVAALYGVFLRVRQALARGIAPEVRPDDPQLDRVRQLCARLPEEYRSPYRLLPAALDVAEAAARGAAPAAPGAAGVAAIVDGLEARFAAALGTPDAKFLAPEDAAAATDPPDEERETPADRRRRASLEAWLREALAALAGHPKRLLHGFAPDAVAARATGAGWGELLVTLRRDRERLRVRILPREVAPHGFCTTPHFTVMHDADTPVDTDDKRRTLDVVARGFERYVAARERAGGAA